MSAEQQQIEQMKEHIKSLEEKFQQLKDQVDKATSKRKEEFYQRHLEKLLNGRHSKNNHGFSDVENEESIHEIKGWKEYKDVVGQLKAYSFKQAKRKRLVAAFYGDVSEQYKQKAVEFINSEQIDVVELVDLPDGGIFIKPLGLNCSNCESNENTSNDNCGLLDYERKVQAIVQLLTQDSKSILGKKHIKNKFKELYGHVYSTKIVSSIEKEIREVFGINWMHSRLHGQNYKGWLGLRFKTKEELETS